jgi:hypothetical protein
VAEDQIHFDPTKLIRVQQCLQQMFAVLRQSVVEIDLCSFFHLVQLLALVLAVVRWLPVQKLIQQNAQGPNINRIALVLAEHNFRGHIIFFLSKENLPIVPQKVLRILLLLSADHPKSQILILFLLSINKFSGFKSLWIILLRCRNSIPRQV